MDKIIKTIKKIKLKNLVILLLLLIFNTYAWFIYNTQVNTEVSVHVSSWNVEFLSGEGISKEILIQVDRVFPGMDDFEHEVKVQNKGETPAKLDYKLETLEIMEEKYEVSDTLTSEELEKKIEEEYPFKIKISKNEEALAEKAGIGKFVISVVWPYESGDDEADTLWGNKAYEYYAVNPDAKCIQLKLKLIATQQ